MSKACACEIGLRSTGAPNCTPVVKVARKAIYVPYFANDGSINKIDLSVDLNQAFWDAALTNTDNSKRYFPSLLFDNVEELRNDPIFESLNSGANIFVQDGTATFAGWHVGADPSISGKYDGYKCIDLGVFIVDLDGNLIGNTSEDGFLRPIRVAKNTFYPLYMRATDTTIAKVAARWEWHRTECDGDLGLVSASDIGIDLLDYDGLIEVTADNETATSTTEATFDLVTCFGSAKNPIKAQGVVIADLSVFNQTTQLAVVPSTLVESTINPGSYTLTFPAQTSSDVLAISVLSSTYVTKEAFTVTIP